jgi:RNA polymerase subunit RPABC4/transcription elongation factor Spt4
MRRLQACRNCKRFTYDKVCPFCQSTNLSTSWKGMIIVHDVESEVAKTLNLKEPGKYAIYVG